MIIASDIVYGLIIWFIASVGLFVLAAFIGLLEHKFRSYSSAKPGVGRARTAGVLHGPAPAVLADRPLHLVDRA